MKKIIGFVLAFVISFCALAFVGCNEQKNEQKTNRQLIYILHGGGKIDGLRIPNAQEAFDYYYQKGFRYFEYDLRLSKDGKLFATHTFEYLDTDNFNPTYEEFTSLKLQNGCTPVNEDWLVQTLKTYSDVKFVIDAKMDTIEEDVLVLKRIEELESIHGIDLSDRIIPEIFDEVMWDSVQKCTTFDKYFFSHYHVYYGVSKMLELFSSPKIYGMALPIYTKDDGYINEDLPLLKEAGKTIFFFTVTTREEMEYVKSVDADGVYIDDDSLLLPEEIAN